MAANTQPIFPITQNVGHAVVTTQDLSFTAPTVVSTVLTAGANGSRIDGMKIRALGTNVATVLRIFIKDGSTSFTLVYELAVAATTAGTAAITGVDTELIPINLDNMGSSTASGCGVLPPYLKAGQSLCVTVGTTVAAGYAVTVFGGDY